MNFKSPLILLTTILVSSAAHSSSNSIVYGSDCFKLEQKIYGDMMSESGFSTFKPGYMNMYVTNNKGIVNAYKSVESSYSRQKFTGCTLLKSKDIFLKCDGKAIGLQDGYEVDSYFAVEFYKEDGYRYGGILPVPALSIGKIKQCTYDEKVLLNSL